MQKCRSLKKGTVHECNQIAQRSKNSLEHLAPLSGGRALAGPFWTRPTAIWQSGPRNIRHLAHQKPRIRLDTRPNAVSGRLCPVGIHSYSLAYLRYANRTTTFASMSAHCLCRSGRGTDGDTLQSADFGLEPCRLLPGHYKLTSGRYRSHSAHRSQRGDFRRARHYCLLPSEHGDGRSVYGRSVGSARNTGEMAR